VVSISASQSLNASAASRDPIATGLPRLDEALNDFPDQPNQGGILRGHVTEVFGPPGAGKTSLA
jgi:RecA/RadA recombinase